MTGTGENSSLPQIDGVLPQDGQPTMRKAIQTTMHFNRKGARRSSTHWTKQFHTQTTGANVNLFHLALPGRLRFPEMQVKGNQEHISPSVWMTMFQPFQSRQSLIYPLLDRSDKLACGQWTTIPLKHMEILSSRKSRTPHAFFSKILRDCRTQPLEKTMDIFCRVCKRFKWIFLDLQKQIHVGRILIWHRTLDARQDNPIVKIASPSALHQ